MIKKYFSAYTGKEIDEAVKAIVDNGIQLEDFSPELIAEIQAGISKANELIFTTLANFPPIGNDQKLYIATDKKIIYYGSINHYEPISANEIKIDRICCGGAE